MTSKQANQIRKMKQRCYKIDTICSIMEMTRGEVLQAIPESRPGRKPTVPIMHRKLLEAKEYLRQGADVDLVASVVGLPFADVQVLQNKRRNNASNA